MMLSIVAAMGFAAAAPLAKQLYATGMTQQMLLALRFSIAAILLFGYLYFKGKYSDIKISTRREGLLYLLLGVLFFVTAGFYFRAIQYISVSLHVVIFFTFPLHVTIMARIFKKERLTRRRMSALIVAIAGIALMVNGNIGNFSPFGMALSFMSAICNAIYMMVLSSKTLESKSAVVISAYINMVAGILFIVLTVYTGTVDLSMPASDWIRVIIIVVFSSLIAIVALAEAIKRIGPAKVAIVSTFEPVEGIILSVILLGESISTGQMIGTAMILSAILILSYQKKKMRISNGKNHI
jgi:drug/metabolite transporter (DMT)-like permease